jgi:elongation factor Ts
MTISATSVRDLRERTNAGMLDCKKALEETQGDFEKAIEWLRKKGLASAAKKADRLASEGTIHGYIHGEGRVGVLVEVNSETDFVARNEGFKNFVRDVALHIAAMAPLSVSAEEIPTAVVEKEREILKAKAIEQGKKPEMLDKIVEGQIKKFIAENCLMEQKFVKNPDLTVGDYQKQVVATIGENIVVRRFVRYELGEGLQKKQENFAEEVAAQMKGR